MSRLKDQYQNEIVDAMIKKFGYKNIMEVPKLDKVVINMGVGEAKAVRPRREEGGVVIKAGAARPELVAFFHVITLSDDKNKDALSPPPNKKT